MLNLNLHTSQENNLGIHKCKFISEIERIAKEFNNPIEIPSGTL